MRIVLTNDDGFMAPGIQELSKAVKELGEVILVAPTEEKSAIGHGITIWEPIRIKKLDLTGIDQAWAVAGTPADCVKLAVLELACKDCGLLISGINNGPNLGTDILYSGTVSAAIEGAVLGIPSMAVSLCSFESNDYSTAARITVEIARLFFKNRKSLPPDTILNINIPSVPPQEIKGFRVTRLGIREYDNTFDKRVDPRGNTYYWLMGDPVPSGDEDPDIDTVAVENNYVSITPVHFDLTHHKIIKEVKRWGLEKLKI